MISASEAIGMVTSVTSAIEKVMPHMTEGDPAKHALVNAKKAMGALLELIQVQHTSLAGVKEDLAQTEAQNGSMLAVAQVKTEKIAALEADLTAAELKFLTLVTTHQNTVKEKDEAIKVADQKYADALVYWSQDKSASKSWKNAHDALQNKYYALNQRLMLLEGITSDMRSLVKDTLEWAEQKSNEFYEHNGIEDHYKKFREDGQPWRFGVAMRSPIIRRFVEQNDLIREKWDEKVKELAHA